MNNNDMFYNLFNIHSSFLQELTTLTVYEQLNYLYKFSELNNGHLNGIVISGFLIDFIKDKETLISLFKLIDCNKIDINVAVGLLRCSYLFSELILNDYRRIRDFFVLQYHTLKEDPQDIFDGLLEV